MEVSLLLILVRAAQQGFFGKVPGNQVQANRQLVNKAARHRYRWKSGQIGPNRVNIIQIHRDRIVGFVTQPERGGWRRRTGDYVDVCERFFEVISDELPNLLRLQVVGIVIPEACKALMQGAARR